MSVPRTTVDPRTDMAERLPAFAQPLITWITAMPAPNERYRQQSSIEPLIDALLRIAAGVTLMGFGLAAESFGLAAALLFVGGVLNVSGLGLFQVVIFHYCAHGGVFGSAAANTRIGRLISIVLLFKYFDDYKREHTQHHRAQKLITEDDEFATFVINICGMRPGMSRRALWLKLAWILVSPAFHGRFLYLRLKGNLASSDRRHVAGFLAYWSAFAALTLGSGFAFEVFVLWLLPLTALLQAATIFRILVEHSFPEERLLSVRGKQLIAEATNGVFSGRALPQAGPRTCAGAVLWAVWWADLLTLKLFARLVVLVGDAPCHDFHHRRPGSKAWANAMHAREADKQRGCPGYPTNYIDVWGLMNAVDATLNSLANADAALLTEPTPSATTSQPFATAVG